MASKGTYANSKHGLNLLEKFINDTYNRDDVFLRELNRDFIEEFRIWLLTEHQLSHNGAVKYLALLKKVVNRAVANNKMSFNPFATYRLERQTVSPDFLTEEELRKIINFNSPLPRLEQTRDMFLFACYTGLSYITFTTPTAGVGTSWPLLLEIINLLNKGFAFANSSICLTLSALAAS